MFGPGEEFRVLGDFGSLQITREDSGSTNSPIPISHEWFENYIDNLQFSDTSVSKVKELSNSNRRVKISVTIIRGYFSMGEWPAKKRHGGRINTIREDCFNDGGHWKMLG